MHVELAVGRAGDRAVDPVVESVQRVDLVRRDEEVQHARNGSHEHEADEHGAEEEHGGDDQRVVAVERPAREGDRSRVQQRGELRDLREREDHDDERQRRTQQEQVHQLHGREADPSPGADVHRGDPPAADVGRLRGRAVPALPVGHGLSGVQRGGVPELGPVTQRRPDVEHRHLADERVLAEADRARLDDAVVGPVAVEERVLPDHRTVADAEQVGAHGHVPGEDDGAAPDLRAQCPQVERVER